MEKNFKRENNIIVGNHNINREEDLSVLKNMLKENLDNLGSRWLTHMPTFLSSSEIARILWLNETYSKIIEIPGNIIEFGTQYGASFNILNMLRLIHEPWNNSREILSFSTFYDGFVDLNENDGKVPKFGDYSVPKGWENIIKNIIEINTKCVPVKNKFSLIDGDASKTFIEYLNNNKHAIIAYAHFDLDVYAPTKNILKLIIERMPKGSILVFDEINHPIFPGETMAVNEVLGINNLNLKKSKYQAYSSYCII